ncbi:MAG: DUF2071 domain-containing protein [Actinomycetota bacterium]|nr:DUF2071 domain-containing protein [Actinomycetota bacterium]
MADDPGARLAFARRFYMEADDGSVHDYGRSELAFLEWEIDRGVLNDPEPPGDAQAGSPWWRAVNGRLLVEAEEAFILRSEGRDSGTEASNPGTAAWLRFLADPSPQSWYRAHDNSICRGYLAAAHLARQEEGHEQKLMNHVLYRVLFTQAVVDRRPWTLGWLTRLVSPAVDPESSVVNTVVHDPDLYPRSYPLDAADRARLERRRPGFGSLLAAIIDLAVIRPQLGRLYRYAARTLGVPDVEQLHRHSTACYPWGLTLDAGHPLNEEEEEARRIADRPGLVMRAFGAHVGSFLDRGPKKTSGEGQLRRRLALDGIWPIRLPWVMSQHWEHVLYLHYRVPSEQLGPLLPKGVEIDTFDGDAWVSILPLRMERAHIRDLFPIPTTANFPELNVRTYVTHDGDPGVFFLSIDSGSRLASTVARLVFRLPYHRATMTFAETRDGYRLTAERRRAPVASFDVRYRPQGNPAPAALGSLDFFLAERYAMYAPGLTGRLLRGDISHEPWLIEEVEVEVSSNDVLDTLGLKPLDSTPLTAFATGTSARCWLMRSARLLQRVWPRC